MAVLTLVANWVLAFYANQQFRETRRIGERQLRAYITLVNGAVLINNPNEGAVLVWVNLKNSGVTPGYNVRLWINCSILAAASHPFDKAGDFGVSAVVGPGGKFEQNAILPLSDDNLTAILHGTRAFFVWGRVEYTDIFNKPHFFSYKTRMNGPVRVTLLDDERADGWALFPVKDGFDAD